jgi:hypothetical protein
LGEDPETDFEKEITNGSENVLLKSTINSAEALEDSLKKRLQKKQMEFEMMKTEIDRLWLLLNIDLEDCEQFRDWHFGLAPDKMKHMEDELLRLRALKAANVEVIIGRMKKSIMTVLNLLKYGPKCMHEAEREIDGIVGEDTEHSDQILHRLETLLETYEQELAGKSAILHKLDQWDRMIESWRECQNMRTSSSSLMKNRGGKLLELEKTERMLQKVSTGYVIQLILPKKKIRIECYRLGVFCQIGNLSSVDHFWRENLNF